MMLIVVVAVVQQTARKSTGGECLLSSNFYWQGNDAYIPPGKAPRKQLATKAARKTAPTAVRRVLPIFRRGLS